MHDSIAASQLVTAPRRGGYAPIALFVYNRPWHTRQTVEALQRNELASESDLFIFSDAAKTADAIPAVEETRSFIKTIRGFRSINIIEREKNFGLAVSIIGGVGQLCGEFGQAIVMEDDLLTSQYFLRFMNDGLDLYRNEPSVMHISGSTYPVQEFCRSSSYFMHLPLCWGWATWRRAWSSYEKSIDLMNSFDRTSIRSFNFDGTYDYWSQLELNRSEKINTWFIFWYATVFLRKALVLFPRQSLVMNIGMDGTGVHCGATRDFDVEIAKERIRLTPIPLRVSEDAYFHHKKYFKSIVPSLGTRGVRKVKRIVRRLWLGGMSAAR